MSESRMWWTSAAVLGVLIGSGCSSVSLPSVPGVYRIDVQQGNVVTGEMLAQLEPGMEKRKVRFLLGTPLMMDTFNTDRWDYLYTFEEGGGARVQRHVVVVFEGDRLLRVEGDVVPAALRREPERHETVVSVPDQPNRTIFGRLRHALSDDVPSEPVQEAKAEEPEGAEGAAEGFLSRMTGVARDEEGESGETTAGAEDDPEPEVEVVRVDPTGSLQPSSSSAPASDSRSAGESEPSEEEGFFQRLSRKFGLGESPDEERPDDEPVQATQ